jgi:hypothetical protein
VCSNAAIGKECKNGVESYADAPPIEDRPMPASPARIEANRRNAALSSGPKTPEGKERSRANAFKHGLTGAGVVLADADAAEVKRLSLAFRDELKVEGEVGHALAHRMAVMSVRMDRCVDQETAALSDRVREALDDFEAPESVDADEAERLRAEAGRRAMFDPSHEATLARKYEAAAERCFFRALRELRQFKKSSAASPVAEVAAEAQASMARLGSFLPAASPVSAKPSEVAAKPPTSPSKPRSLPSKGLPAAWDPFPPTHFDVPIAIGQAR